MELKSEIRKVCLRRRWTRDATELVDDVLPYHLSEEEEPSHSLTPIEWFNNMTLIIMVFCHCNMASKEHYKYAVSIINREIKIIKIMEVHWIEHVWSQVGTKTTQEDGHDLHEPIFDPIVSQTKGWKIPSF